MKRFCDMTRAERRVALRDMLRSLGFDTPDEVVPRQIVVEDDDGNVVKSYWIGRDDDDFDKSGNEKDADTQN